MLGDFNARVGMYDPAEGLWHGTIGGHRIDEGRFMLRSTHYHLLCTS